MRSLLIRYPIMRVNVMHSRQSLFPRYLIIAVIGIFLVMLMACSSEPAEEKAAAVRPVKLLTISYGGDESIVSYPAVIDASQSSDLSFQVDGKIAELNVKEAQLVSKGDIIAKLNAEDFDSKLASAKAQYEVADEEFLRAERLLKEDAIARNVVEQRKSARDVALAAYDSAQKALNDTVIVAPFSGAIAQIPVEAMQRVKAGELVVQLINFSAMDAKFNLPARFISKGKDPEDRNGYVILDALPDRRFAAEFKEARLIADATSQTYAITLTFVPPVDELILPGMSATVEISTANKSSSQNSKINVPLNAFVSEADERIVWVVDNDTMAVSRRVVEVGEGIGETLLVTSGLSSGEVIVIAGADYLSAGMIVRAWDAQK